ncbi:MAG: hypothetical protein AAGD22_09395 [Verrucomicrobiota bacterium]
MTTESNQPTADLSQDKELTQIIGAPMPPNVTDSPSASPAPPVRQNTIGPPPGFPMQGGGAVVSQRAAAPPSPPAFQPNSLFDDPDPQAEQARTSIARARSGLRSIYKQIETQGAVVIKACDALDESEAAEDILQFESFDTTEARKLVKKLKELMDEARPVEQPEDN